MSESIWTGAEVISVYTRKQAIEDGELVDVTEWASSRTGFHGGFTVPVAFTGTLWAAIEGIPKRLEGIADVRGRAHDVLWMASLAAQKGGSDVFFDVILPRRGTRCQRVRLRGNCGPGDHGQPVITIGFSEDF
jgi:hypothetical protein